MKKLLVLMTLLVSFVALNAQTSTTNSTPVKTITVNESDIPASVLAEIRAKQEMEVMTQKMEQYGNWVGVGGEIGSAISEGLNAVKDVAVELGDEKVGRFTMIMIGWKVLGRDVMKLLFGLLFGILGIFTIWRLYKKTFMDYKIATHRPGLIARLWQPTEYKVCEVDDDFEGSAVMKVIYMLAILGCIGISYGIAF